MPGDAAARPQRGPEPAPQLRPEASCTSLAAAVGRLLPRNEAGGDSEAQLLLGWLAGHLFEGVVVFDANGEILYLNDSLCRTLGYRRHEPLGQRTREFLRDVFDRAMRAKGATGSPAAAVRYEARFQGQRERRVDALIAAHRVESGGRPVGCLALVSDISAQVESEALLREAQSDLRLVSAQLLAAEELERKRIARDLHDGLGQSLGGIKFGLESCGVMLARGDTAAAAANVRQLVQGIKGAIEEVRRIAMKLRPVMLDDVGTLALLSWFIREFRAVQRNLRLETIIEVREADIPPQARVSMFRIVQEALGNVTSHSGARNVWVTLQRSGDSIVLGVRDDGVGFDPALFATVDDNGRGLGLASMRERAQSSGGRFILDSKPGQGTHVIIHWHCASSAAPAQSLRGDQHAF